MKLQNYQMKDKSIHDSFIDAKSKNPDNFKRRIDLSWSIWVFGLESLEDSFSRLARYGISYVEMKGDHFRRLPNHEIRNITSLLEKYNLQVSGVCGMFDIDHDLASPEKASRMAAVDYIKSEIEFVHEIGGKYLIVVPSAVGRPDSSDTGEFSRSVETIRLCGDSFITSGVHAAIEPIRSAEVSLIHSVNDALAYIKAVDHQGISRLNCDIYHMLLEEDHIGESLLAAGGALVNLHLADTNRDALGKGMMDVDTVIKSSYLIGMNSRGRYLTPEPLGTLRNPYVRGTEICTPKMLDDMVAQTVSCFREREEFVRSL